VVRRDDIPSAAGSDRRFVMRMNNPPATTSSLESPPSLQLEFSNSTRGEFEHHDNPPDMRAIRQSSPDATVVVEFPTSLRSRIDSTKEYSRETVMTYCDGCSKLIVETWTFGN
jgi:hypothetical protein